MSALSGLHPLDYSKTIKTQVKETRILFKTYVKEERIDKIFLEALSASEKEGKERIRSRILVSNKVVFVNEEFLSLRDLVVQELIKSDINDLKKMILASRDYKKNYFLHNVINLLKIYKKINTESDIEDFWLELIQENDFNGALELVKIRKSDKTFYTLSLVLLARRVFDKSIESALLIIGSQLRRSLLLIIFSELDQCHSEFLVLFSKIQSFSDREFIKNSIF